MKPRTSVEMETIVLLGSLLILASCMPGAVSTCDDYSWEELSEMFDRCLQKAQVNIIKASKITSKNCENMRDAVQCSQLLFACRTSQPQKIAAKLAKIPFTEKQIDACERHDNREPRSPFKSVKSASGPDSGSGRGRPGVGRALDAVKRRITVVKRMRRPGAAASRSSFSTSPLTSALALAKKPKKDEGNGDSSKNGQGKVAKKVGTAAVAGLAAYGTYKGAKQLSKSVRSAYDDDDCWEFNVFQDRFECECRTDCQVYTSSAQRSLASASSSILLLASLFLAAARPLAAAT